MDIICHNCHSKFRIADEKIPTGKSASFQCPKCKSKISLGSNKNSAKTGAELGVSDDADAYDAAEKPFDFIEEEGITALVCETNPLVRKTITAALELMEYQITIAESARDALKRMRYHVYDLIVVNESFNSDNPDANGVLIYLERLNMTVRRNMFVAMVSNRYRTMDNMMALNKSVNLIINTKNIEDIGKILSRAITDNEYFYRVFKETLKEVGRA
ncbi:MAG: zinc-ribbon domain-containing protein [Desulfobacterales bacterium]|nr:MAG: zinc-ribbon domain-containing protein [Desulfobacterales bacterium]